ncbi:MAG: 2-hydroxy-3-oxopropionate reductase [Limnochordia bacterium]|nr:2-hydroxy-3-oxopropionate reductase [Limnochordia bacterium]MDI9465826.1 2-hydroxy-3-oxopropionate reductase [Bacillota bacterium]NLO96248.1 2-hydroxy-3-oxopropionate reductase [Bacillota bacterium]HAN94767.1 2-hydroxy-3-oxopropionate reductase [Bacillota bacterium]HOB41185.1 2-hydroxy-3-oxopropionate reductase [Limnochordia bacterium]
MRKIGFIGLGLMGRPMALNLLKAGYPLTVYDRNEHKVAALVEAGAQGAKTPREVAEAAEVIVTMLPNSPHVREVVFGENGLYPALRPGQYFVDMSSISPLAAKEIAERLQEKGVEALDAPVSGGVEKAQAGTLAVMVGGSEQAFAAVKDVLGAMAGSIVLVGPAGAGQMCKLVNQMIVAVNIAVIAEALTLGKKAGVDPERIFQAIRGGLAGSQCLEDKAPRMFSGNFAPGFRINLHAKDLANVLETSRELNVAVPLTAQVMEMLQVLLGDGLGDRDHGGLALFYEKLNSLSLKQES